MSTMDLVTACVPSSVRPHWCRPDGEGVFGVLWIVKQGDLAMTAAVRALDRTAQERGFDIKEVARVPRGGDEAIYVRGEPRA